MSALPTHGDVDPGQTQHHGLWRFRLTRLGDGLSEQGSTQGELASAPSIAQQPVVAQPGKAAREHVQEEASDELAGVEAHHLELVAAGVVAPSETHLHGVEVDEAVVGDSALVGVAPEVSFSTNGSVCVAHALRVAGMQGQRAESPFPWPLQRTFERGIESGRMIGARIRRTRLAVLKTVSGPVEVRSRSRSAATRRKDRNAGNRWTCASPERDAHFRGHRQPALPTATSETEFQFAPA